MSVPAFLLSGPDLPISHRWRGPDGIPYHQQTRGERVCAFLEQLRVPEGDLVGQRLRLADFQILWILDTYDNPARTRRSILSLARKNGKTSLLAGLLLCHLCGPEARPNAQLVSGAMSRDQAALIHSLASKIVKSTPEIRDQVRLFPSGKRLLGLATNAEYQALAADGKTTQGLSPVFAILDEIGQVRGSHSPFVDAITSSQGAHRAALLVVISTQAATDTDLLSIWLDDAAVSSDERLVCHLYSTDAGSDLLDPDGWAAANPALGLFRSVDDLRDQLEQAKRMPSAESGARNLLLNQRVTTKNPFVSHDVWQSCSAAPAPLEGMKVFGGLDLSMRTDLTSLVLVGFDSDGKRHVHCVFWTPAEGIHDRAQLDRMPYVQWQREGWLRTTPGSTVDYDAVARDVAELVEGLDLRLLAFDRWRIDLFRKELELLGIELPLSAYGQGFRDMAPALELLEADLLNGRLQHGNHPVLSMCAANAVALSDPAGNRKLDRARANGRIDGMVALAMALGVAGHQEAGPEPEYSMLIL